MRVLVTCVLVLVVLVGLCLCVVCVYAKWNIGREVSMEE